MIVIDRFSAHDSHGRAVLTAPREDTKHTEEKKHHGTVREPHAASRPAVENFVMPRKDLVVLCALRANHLVWF